MTNKQEILFWQQAKKLIREGYGKPCQDFDLECVGCRANLVASWINNQIFMLKQESSEVFVKLRKN